VSEEAFARYDYAWNTPGFTAQNNTWIPGVNGYVNPGMPDDVSKVRVFGEFLELDSGRPLEGVLRLRVDQILTHVPSGRQVMAGGMKPIRFKRDGFSIYLPATDDPQLTPEFTYHARLTVRGQRQEFTFSLPAAEAEVNITTLIEQTA
jgi:hypothetical protein